MKQTIISFPLICVAMGICCSMAGCDGKKKEKPYEPPAVCREEIQLPKTLQVWVDDIHSMDRMFDDSEFVLDPHGAVVTVDRDGNVVRRAFDGSISVLAEKVVRTARGLAYLSTGELVIADSGRGKLVLVYPDGQSRILVQHLDFPHGVSVDRDDTIYVAESSRGAISRVHPRTGEVETVAMGLPMAPAGVSFSPDYKSLYIVGSSPEIYAMDRDESGVWGKPYRFATVPGGPSSPCDGLVSGDPCFDENGVEGVCTDDGFGGLFCKIEISTCAGKQEGDRCLTENGMEGVCTDDGFGGLWCKPRSTSCANKNPGDACVEWGSPGLCEEEGDGTLVCRVFTGCEGKTANDPCITGGFLGRCELDGADRLACRMLSACAGKQSGDACTEWGSPGICMDTGGNELMCQPVDPCADKNPGDSCIGAWETPGVCVAYDAGYISCEPLPSCEGKQIGDPCSEYGRDGTCAYGGFETLFCEIPPDCPTGADESACTWNSLTPGACMDSTQGHPYCQSLAVCQGLSAGDPCFDGSMSKTGVCVPGADGLVCQLSNPCTEVGQECWWSGEDGTKSRRPADAGREDFIIAPPEDEMGVCIESSYGLLYCIQRGPCWGLAVGDSCETDWGTPGVCVDTGGDQLFCEERYACTSEGEACVTWEGTVGICEKNIFGELDCRALLPCEGLHAGDACRTASGVDGVCVEDGTGGFLCRPTPACAGKAPGDACQSPVGGIDGVCAAGAGGQSVCQPKPSCEGKSAGDACYTPGGTAGVCTAWGQGPLFCDARLPGGLLRAVAADACGNVYAADAGTRVLWRFTPQGEPQMVASELRAPVTGLFWGRGVGGWDDQTLYVGYEGGARIDVVPLHLPGRPLVKPKTGAKPPKHLPKNMDDICLNLPNAPLEVNQLEDQRGYHDITFDDRGWMVGFDGTALVAVSKSGQTQAVASGLLGVQGLAALPDGSVAVAADKEDFSGVLLIAPSGAQTVLAQDLPGVYGLTVGPDGRLYAADGQRVYRIDPTTREMTTFLNPADFGQEWQPRIPVFDQDASLMYVASFGDSVYAVPLDGNLEPAGPPHKLGLVVEGGMYLDALVVDICGNMYIAHFGNRVLYRVSPDGRSRLFYQWDADKYGHGGDWGDPRGGWRDDAIYMPQPYFENKVNEVVIGIPGVVW